MMDKSAVFKKEFSNDKNNQCRVGPVALVSNMGN